MSAKWEKICTVDEVPAGQRKRFPLGALDILIINTGKRFYACAAECPHMGETLETAEIHGHVLTCSAHQYQLDLSSGKCPSDADLEIPVFPVEVRDGAVWVKA